MAVQSYLNLYTWLLGWQLYDQIWSMLAILGFLAIPFAVLAIKVVFEPLASGSKLKDLSENAVTRLNVHMLLALLVLLFAGVPMVELQPSQVNYTPTCVQGATSVTPNHTNTTYDNLVTIPDSIRVPLWWYLIMAISNGFTDQAKSLVSCPIVNLRALQSELVTTNIKSAQTKAEVIRFKKECYFAAQDRFVHVSDPIKQQEIQKALAQYGLDDTDWVGSETLQTVGGFYDSLYAQSPVNGFPYLGNDQDKIQSQTGQPQWGTPSCKTWWQDNSHGLRAKLYAEFDGNTQKTLAEISGTTSLSQVQDAVIRGMLTRQTGGDFFHRGYGSEEDNVPDNWLGKITASIGADMTTTEQFPKIHMLQNMLPIFQALVEYMVFILLPIMLVFSGYSIRFVISASFFIFAIIFMSFLWHAVTYIDNFLMQAIYQAYKADGSEDTIAFITHLVVEKANPYANILDFVVSTFYVASTLILLFMAGWTGWKGGSAIAGNSRAMEGISESGGGKGGGAVRLLTKLVK